MDSREQFELAYEEMTGLPVVAAKAYRMGNGSYSLPGLSKAWVWWQLSRERVTLELPPVQVAEYEPLGSVEYRKRCRAALEEQGLKWKS